MLNKDVIYQNLLDNLQKGGVYLITGENGSGKTDFLRYISHAIHEKLATNNLEYSKLLCFSNTILDKFPLDSVDNYYYFGIRGKSSASNLLAIKNPFRKALMHIFQWLDDYVKNVNKENEEKFNLICKEISDNFNKLGFEPIIKIKLRKERNSKIELSTTLYEINFKTLSNSTNFTLQDDYLQINNWLLSDEQSISIDNLYCIKRNNYSQAIEINNLSSGERFFILMILAVSLNISDKSIVLYDEPENSLHPQWQIDFISILNDLVNKMSNDSILIIATHSPLIASHIKKELLTIQFPLLDNTEIFQTANYIGNTADVVYKKLFNVINTRSPEFLVLFQECLDLYIKIKIDENVPEEFKTKFNELENLGVLILPDDQLYSAYQVLKEEYLKINNNSNLTAYDLS